MRSARVSEFARPTAARFPDGGVPSGRGEGPDSPRLPRRQSVLTARSTFPGLNSQAIGRMLLLWATGGRGYAVMLG